VTDGEAVRPVENYLQHLREGRFMLQRSRSSGRFIFYPRVAEPGTGAQDLEWIEASGRGIVYAATIQRAKPPTPDTSLVLVELEEGPRMLSRVEGIAPDAVRIGMAVRARIVAGEGNPFVVFEPAEEGA
jgi:uncharacterized protein